MSPNGQTIASPHACRVAVIGGGISGLAAAHRLLELADADGAPVRVVLFEAGPGFGGVLCTEKIRDYSAELGADSFITNKPWGVDLCRRLGLEDRLIATDPKFRQALVLHKGRPVPVPDGFLLMAPAKIWPIVTSPIFSPLGKLRMGLEYFLPRRVGAADESVAAFVRRRLGREALDLLVQPLVAGIYTSDPEKLSMQATLPRFIEMERRHRSLVIAARRERRHANDSTGGESGARYGLFVSLKHGMSELVSELVRRIELAGKISVNAGVSAIRKLPGSDERFSLTFSPDTDVHDSGEFDAVIVALPADRAAEIVQPLDGNLASELRTIDYASSAIVVTGHSLADVSHPLNGSGLVVPAIERRQILSVSFASRKFAGRAPVGKVVLRTFVGGALQPQLLAHTDDELIRIATAELREILGVRGQPDFAVVSRHERAMPQYHVGHLDRVRRIEAQLALLPRLALAGNAYDGVGIPDCIRSGELAAERIMNTCRARSFTSR